jgi:hypothetical protein
MDKSRLGLTFSMLKIQTNWLAGTVSINDGHSAISIQVITATQLAAQRAGMLDGMATARSIEDFAARLANLLDIFNVPRAATEHLT